MSQEGRGCLVGDQGGSDKVAQFKMEGLRSSRRCFSLNFCIVGSIKEAMGFKQQNYYFP